MDTTHTPLLQLNALSKTYRTEEIETTALAGVDLTVSNGEFLAVMGPSGCGKSTLLNLVGLVDTADSGHYLFDGQDVTALGESQRTVLRKRRLGFIFQSFNLIDELSVRENVELPLLYQGVGAAQRRTRVDEMLDRVGIGHRAGHRPAQLSGGQQQRVAVARALVGQPSLILADEPTGNLDSRHGNDVMEMLRGLSEEGRTILMVTHSSAHADYASRVVHMIDGRITHETRQRAASAHPLHAPLV